MASPSLARNRWSRPRSCGRRRDRPRTRRHGRGEIDPHDADTARLRLEGCPVERVDRPELGAEAWRLANELGLAKTYDAEYLALAHLLECRLVTLDRRLRRGADRLGFVIGPSEL